MVIEIADSGSKGIQQMMSGWINWRVKIHSLNREVVTGRRKKKIRKWKWRDRGKRSRKRRIGSSFIEQLLVQWEDFEVRCLFKL